ncbi:hypothetical protein J2W56_006302 [Nocardia kruczakiae]|uniref:Uncharacterized protein n=1 Tax=Nocardia kruczakiae TaxID=261477 RepID=A0ABU1XPP6_9NOCA|nr:hypothetical protein [Nocardia kruczakiae]MDR7172537.1 hypothetical protein [Nocardia kruczakiae]
MSTEKVWDATSSLAEIWQRSKTVQLLRSQLPTNNPSDHGIPEMLRNIDAGTQHLVFTEPLIPNKWGPMGAQLPLVDMRTPGGAEFLTKVQPVGFAAECNTAWLRSRVPGYPMIPVPQLAANTHLTSDEIGPGLGWRRQALQGGLQFESAPRAAEILGVSRQDYDAAARELVHALQATPEWLMFGDTLETLTDADRQQLKDARQSLRPLLSAEAVNRHEPERMARRYDYRREQVSEVLSGLTGRANEFARSFDEVNDLIDLASLRVLGQLVAYGGPVDISNVEDLQRQDRVISFRSADPVLPGALIRIADPLTPDTAIVTGAGVYTEETGLVVDTYEAELLPGAGAF